MVRICSLIVLVALAAPVCAQTLVGAARVVDGDTLVVAERSIRLMGIDAPERGQSCTDAAGRGWDCGGFATAALERLARDGVRCSGTGNDRYGRLVARCSAAGGDIGAALVEGGAAFAYARYSAEYLPAEARARDAGRGVWQGQAQRPDLVRAAGRAGEAPAGCAIKGNISAGGRLYHLPGGRSYGATRISTGNGERWFCSEAEARAAGWRKARG